MTTNDFWFIVIVLGLLYAFSSSRKEMASDIRRKKMKNR